MKRPSTVHDTSARWSRRGFLQGLAGLAAVPFVARLARRAHAADPTPRGRMVVFYTGQGHHRDQYLSGSGGLGPMFDSLAPYADRTLLLHNITGNSGHYAGHAESLTGRPNGETFTAGGGPSLDQILADRHRGVTVLPSLELGCFAGNGADGMIAYSSAGLPIPAAQDPRGVFDRMFRLLNEDPAVAARRRTQDKSVLDVIAADLDDMTPKLSSDARRLLDAHLTIVREQETALAHPVPVAACELGASPTMTDGGYDYPTLCRLQLDNAVAALACDVTRVVTFMLGYAQNTTVHRWLGHSDDFHQIAHGSVDDSAGKMLAIDRWQAEQFSYLVGRLDTLGLLDQTLVVWISELGLHYFDHSKTDAGVVLAGNVDGFFRSGRVVDMAGAHYHDLLLTIGHALGATDLSRFGASGTKVLTTLS